MRPDQLDQFRQEVKTAVEPILAKYGMDMLPSTLTYERNCDAITLPIKATKHVTVTTALTASNDIIKHGLARPGTKAMTHDRTGRLRPVIITEVRRTKYAFYFTDAPRHDMIGPFHLFSSTEPTNDQK